MPMANKANWKNPHSQIDMRDELTRVSEQEGQQLAARLDRGMQQRFDQVRTTEIVEFKSE